ncbi:DNA starvation/stationary phase protection protein [Candidatus Hepatincolaceae symbiont of Richtersius coronifer]
MTTNNTKCIHYLNELLSNSYILYNKTQNYHWNIKTSNFIVFHKLFQEHYENLQEALDEIAERVVILNGEVEGKLSYLINKSQLSDQEVNFKDKTAVLNDLIVAHLVVENIINDAFESNMLDAVTQDLFVNRAKFHQKALWVLSASLA